MRTFKNNKSRAKSADAAGFRIVRNAAGDEATVYVYDEISFWGINAQDFVKELSALKVGTIHLRINSPGGSVFDAMAMTNALRNHPAKVVSHIDGLAASSASFLALGADEVRMSDNAFFMIHNPWSIAMGTATEFRKTADLLDKVADSIIGEYEKRSDVDNAQIVQWMDDETWFTAEEALANGFVDHIDGAADEPQDRYDLSLFNKVPAALHPRAVAKSKQDVENDLREAGYSRSHAKAIAAMAASKLSLRDAGTVDDTDEVPDADEDDVDAMLANSRALLASITTTN